MKGTVFDIQHYCIYDGPGIRTVAFFKGCPLRCAWCQNPESQQKEPQIAYDRRRCSHCGSCVSSCPSGALKLSRSHILRSTDRCKLCGTCTDLCPSQAIEMIGFEISSEELIEKVEKDRPFYESSGGGMTVSGGEPCFQGEFLVEVLGKARQRGIHTALETTGVCSESFMLRLAPLVDIFLYDIKHISNKNHGQKIGVSNRKILRNFRTLLELVGSQRIIARIPIVPGFNDNPIHSKSLVKFLLLNGFKGEVHLMPYNRLTQSKYEKLGMQHQDFGELTERVLDRFSNCFSTSSMTVKISQ